MSAVVHWKLKELLDAENVSGYALVKQLGYSRQATVYNLITPTLERRPQRVGFPLLADLLNALYVLTGKRFSVSDIMECDWEGGE